MFPVTVVAPAASVPLVATFCEPKLGAIFVPSIAADALISLLTNEPLVTPTVILPLLGLLSVIVTLLPATISPVKAVSIFVSI